LRTRLSLPKGLIFLWVLALFAWWVRYHPPGSDLLVFDDDARQHVYWTARFQDPDLFKDDLLTAFISSPVFDPPGYRFLYQLGVQFLDPLPFSQLITLFLLLLSLGLLEWVARGMIPDPRGRVFLGLLFLFFSLYDASGGFPRSFVYPLLLGFLLLLQRGALPWASLIVLLEAVLYPPILLNTLALAGVDFLGRWRRGENRKRYVGDVLWLTLAAAAAFLLLTAVYSAGDREILGRQVTVEEARAMPEFHSEGRTKFFRETLWEYLLIGRSGIGAIHLIGFAIILAAMGLTAGFRSIRVPSWAVHLTWTSLVLFAAAHLLLFRLHLPSRYTTYTMPLAFMLVIGASTGEFLARVGPGWERIWERALGRWRRRVGWGVLMALLATYAYVQGHFIARVDTQVVALEPMDREMLAFVATLPKEATVAGHPMDMNNVPLLSRRKVLVNQELSMPYYLGYYMPVRQRLFDLFEAYYAGEWSEVESFVERYRVDGLVVRKAHFEAAQLNGMLYWEPFNRFVKQRWKGDERFALRAPPREFRCFENERYVVLCWNRKENL
jgi:hypothetical protein